MTIPKRCLFFGTGIAFYVCQMAAPLIFWINIDNLLTHNASSPDVSEGGTMAEKSSNIDYKLMLPGVIVTAFIGVLLALFPTGGKAAVDTIFGILTHNFKWLFLTFAAGKTQKHYFPAEQNR